MKIRPHSTHGIRMVTVSIFTVLAIALIPLGTINALTLKDVITTLRGTTDKLTSTPSSGASNTPSATTPSSTATSTDSSTATTSSASSAATSTTSAATTAASAVTTEAIGSTLGTTLSAASIRTASAQAAQAASATTYSSNKISQIQADQLYKFAASGVGIALVIYAITLLPLQRNQRKALSFSQSQL